MTDSDYRVSRYDGALQLLPSELRETARRATRREREAAEELRLRVGRPMTILLPEGERELGDGRITARDISRLVENATGASIHSAAQEIRRGYISCRGGYRLGLAGSVYSSGGEVGGFHTCSSAAVRISREFHGAAEPVMAALIERGRFRSTLIMAPPGAGKTTFLRDAVRLLSGGVAGMGGLRVSLADERGEVAGLWEGAPQLDVGPRTDILEGCPKAEAVMMLLRSMNPEVIALDEITAPEDVTAISRARGCGVALLATAHADGVEDLVRRPLYRQLFDDKVFERYVVIKQSNGRRSCEVVKC